MPQLVARIICIASWGTHLCKLVKAVHVALFFPVCDDGSSALKGISLGIAQRNFKNYKAVSFAPATIYYIRHSKFPHSYIVYS